MQYEVGQEVAISLSRSGHVRGVVERLTKTQTIVKIGGRVARFDVNGYEIGVRGSWGRDRLMPLTQKIADDIRHTELVARLTHMKWATLPLATLERVAAALDADYPPPARREDGMTPEEIALQIANDYLPAGGATQRAWRDIQQGIAAAIRAEHARCAHLAHIVGTAHEYSEAEYASGFAAADIVARIVRAIENADQPGA